MKTEETDIKFVDFGSVPVDSEAERLVNIPNTTNAPVSYRVSKMYSINNIDCVFKVSITSGPVNPSDIAALTVAFKPTLPNLTFTEYYIIDNSNGARIRLTVTGTCFGPQVLLNKSQLSFEVVKKISEHRVEEINIHNKSVIDTTYQWLIPLKGQGYFQISTGNCGVIRALETIRTTILFTGTALGIYTAEIVCLILNQEPLFINAVATIVIPGYSLFDLNDHVFTKNFDKICRNTHLMENSLNILPYIPSVSVSPTFLNFGMGSVDDNKLNISLNLFVTNHEQQDGYIQWMPDPDNLFLVDPIASVIPPQESRQFTVRFRPKLKDNLYGYLMFGDYQQKIFKGDQIKLKHTWFRIPCIGTTWSSCTEWATQWDCPTEIIMPPTVPARTTFKNFGVSNKLETPMHFIFEPPEGTNFVVMPLCGIIPSRGWEIITIAMEPKEIADFYENWDLVINGSQRVRMRFSGNSEISSIEMISNGYNPETDAMNEFAPTITGSINYSTTYIHNLTRMVTHIRVLNHVPWLGADNCGAVLLNPKEMFNFQWWFYPKEADKVYNTIVTLSCLCLINGSPVGEPTEFLVNITGFSELPDLRVIPRKSNLHDIVVGESTTVDVILFNYCSCILTSKLFYEINSIGDDHTGDRLEIVSAVNTLKPSTHCNVKLSVTANGAGSRHIKLKYLVLFRDDRDKIVEVEIIKKVIYNLWYDGIYPTLKIMRTISKNCPVILSNHCVWCITNVVALNKALMDCRPNKPYKVNIYAPDLCVHSGSVNLIFVMGCVYRVPVAWNLRREKICDCKMVEVEIAISNYEMRHNCIHREMVKLFPLNGIVSPENPGLLHLKFRYSQNGSNTLCYVLTLPNDRTIHLYVNMFAHEISRGILTPLRRFVDYEDYLCILECGRVPINNLDPVIRIVWLYNPTDVFTTWRLLRGNVVANDAVIRCLLYFAEVPPLGKLALPFAFMPTEMIDYEVIFLCSFGYDTKKILVKGQGGLPNCLATRLDMPSYIPQIIRAAHRTNIVYLSKEHFTLPIMSTHSLTREIVAICNNTEDTMRFIWLPERTANIVNVVMTPCWGVIHANTTEWITMSVYTLQEPSTFTITIACEILNLSAHRNYQRNEMLRRTKLEKCNQEFIITDQGMHHLGINACPPYVLELKKPHPFYLAMTVSLSSIGQRDGYPRLLLKQMWEQTPPYDLLSSEISEQGKYTNRASNKNNIPMADIIRIIDGILWDALHSKMFRNQIEFYAKEDIPTYSQLVNVLHSETKPRLSRRVTSGICDAIVNKAIFHAYSLNPKHETITLVEL